MTSRDAKKLLGILRLAVAIALLQANFAWAQFTQQPVQAIDTRVTGRYDANPDGTGAVQPGLAIGSQVTEQYLANPDAVGTPRTGQDLVGEENGRDSSPLRGITVRVSGGLGYDDNVFRTESNTSSDYFWLIQPSVYLSGGFGKHGFGLGYEGAWSRYSEYGNLDYDDHRLFADADLDLSRKLDLTLLGELSYGHDPRGGVGTCIVCPTDLDTWRAYRVGGELIIGRRIARAQITPGIEFSGIRYTNNGQSSRDFDRQAYGLRGRLGITPRLSVVAQGGYAIINHLDPGNDLDRTETVLLGGIEWEATAKTSGEILIGSLYQDFDDPARGSSTNFNWLARVHWSPKPYSKVTVYTSRQYQEDASGGVGYFLANTFGASWRHGFTERLAMDTNVDYTIADYETGREDKYLAFQIGFTHRLISWLDFGAHYRYSNRRSNIPGINYDDNTVLLNLTVGIGYGL